MRLSSHHLHIDNKHLDQGGEWWGSGGPRDWSFRPGTGVQVSLTPLSAHSAPHPPTASPHQDDDGERRRSQAQFSENRVPANPKSPRTSQSRVVFPTGQRVQGGAGIWTAKFQQIFLQWHPSDVLSKCQPAENTFSVQYESGLGNAYPFEIADRYCRKRFR